MKTSTKLSLLLAFVSTFALASITSAASTVTVNGNNFFLNSNVTSTVLDTTAGITQAGTTGIVFGTVTINMASTIPVVNSSDFIRVDDNRGTSTGWNVTVSATDFSATVTDQSVATGTVTVAIPASQILTVSPQTPTALFTSELANVAAQSTGTTPVTSGSGIKIMNVAKGYGQGVYKQQLNYALTMPNYLPTSTVVTATNSTSKFLTANRTAGAKIGLFAGTYTSTISYSITTGP